MPLAKERREPLKSPRLLYSPFLLSLLFLYILSELAEAARNRFFLLDSCSV